MVSEEAFTVTTAEPTFFALSVCDAESYSTTDLSLDWISTAFELFVVATNGISARSLVESVRALVSFPSLIDPFVS